MHSPLPAQPLPTIDPSKKIAVVRSGYYDDLVTEAENAARETLIDAGVPEGNIKTVIVTGAFEIPLACKKAIEDHHADGIIALGVIIEGDTHHAEEISRSCTDGIMQIQLEKNVPIAHAVLYADELKHAEERYTGKNNKGKEAAICLLRTMHTF